MYQLKFVFLTAFFLPLFCALKTNGQDAIAGIVNSLDEVMIPIETLAPDSSFSDLHHLKQRLKNKNIVALGEGTHGTKEFFQYKDRLIRFLVSELGYKAVAFESDFTAVQNLDDYINYKKDQINTGYGGFPLTKETRLMLSWLREYNQSKDADDRVHLYGIEARGFNNISDSILNSLSDLPEACKQVLTKIKQKSYTDLTKKDIQEVKTIIPQLEQYALKHDHVLYRHYVNLLAQLTDNYLAYKVGHRDQYMAENTSWIIENTNSKNVILWAHNGHLSKTAIYKGYTLGNRLYEKYESGYFAIATTFNKGEVTVSVRKKGKRGYQKAYYPEVTSKIDYSYYFKQCKNANFMIDMSAVKDHEVLQPFFLKKRLLRMIGATGGILKVPLSISENFDLLIYFNTTHAG